MCKAQQSYLPYLTAAGSGTLPLNITTQPCAGYMIAYNAATKGTSQITGCPITEPTLFDVSHCPIFKLIPVFVSSQDFVVLDFASLPKVDAIQAPRTNTHVTIASTTASTPIVGAFQKRHGTASTTATLQAVDEVAKSYSSIGTTANTPIAEGFQNRHTRASTKTTTGVGLQTVNAVQHASHKFKDTAMGKNPNTMLGKTNFKPIAMEDGIPSSTDSGEWHEDLATLSTAMSPLAMTNGRKVNHTISPMTPKKLVYSPRTLRNIGRDMRNAATYSGQSSTGVKTVEHERINPAGPILENVREEDVEWQKRAIKWLEKADSVPEVL